jgi:hypothetical protein
MSDRPIIASGVAAFLAIATLPFWYNAFANRPSRLNLAPADGKRCVAPVEVMRRSHMNLLHKWRDLQVRDGVRSQAGSGGRAYDIALNRTCVDQCHHNKAEFCDRCHTYVGLKGPDCWNCHETKQPLAAIAERKPE